MIFMIKRNHLQENRCSCRLPRWHCSQSFLFLPTDSSGNLTLKLALSFFIVHYLRKLQSPRSDTPHDLLLARSGLTPLESRRKFIRAVMAYKIVHLSLPPHLVPLAQQWLASHMNGQRTALRNKLSIRLPRPKTDYPKRSPFYASLSEWNKLAQYLKCSMSLSLFRKSLASSAD